MISGCKLTRSIGPAVRNVRVCKQATQHGLCNYAFAVNETFSFGIRRSVHGSCTQNYPLIKSFPPKYNVGYKLRLTSTRDRLLVLISIRGNSRAIVRRPCNPFPLCLDFVLFAARRGPDAIRFGCKVR